MFPSMPRQTFLFWVYIWFILQPHDYCAINDDLTLIMDSFRFLMKLQWSDTSEPHVSCVESECAWELSLTSYPKMEHHVNLMRALEISCQLLKATTISQAMKLPTLFSWLDACRLNPGYLVWRIFIIASKSHLLGGT